MALAITTITARQIIIKAMQKAGILTKSEVPDDDEANDALDNLNYMISSWSNESALIYARTWESFPLVQGQDKYTIGAGGNFNTVRPILIAGAHTRWNGIDYAMEPLTDEIYTDDIAQKYIQSIPNYYNYDYAYPLGNIRVFPVPQIGGMTIFLLTEKELTQFTLDTAIVLPPGWIRALIYNLAVEISGEYQLQVPPVVQDIANKSKGAIQQAILKNRSMDAKPPGTNLRRDIQSGRV